MAAESAGAAAPQPAPAGPLAEGRDFYRDPQGRVVFTERFNRARGYCCFLACRHCPWGQAGRTPAQAFADLQQRLDALEARLAEAGLPVDVQGYRNGVLTVLPPQAVCATDLPAAERLLRSQADGLLTVVRIVWS